MQTRYIKLTSACNFGQNNMLLNINRIEFFRRFVSFCVAWWLCSFGFVRVQATTQIDLHQFNASVEFCYGKSIHTSTIVCECFVYISLDAITYGTMLVDLFRFFFHCLPPHKTQQHTEYAGAKLHTTWSRRMKIQKHQVNVSTFHRFISSGLYAM